MQLKKADLGFAYERAGESFSGQMSQNFFVLNDEDVIYGPCGNGGSGPPKLTGVTKENWKERMVETANQRDRPTRGEVLLVERERKEMTKDFSLWQ